MAQEELAIVVRMRDFASQQFARLRGVVGTVTGELMSLRGALLGAGAGFAAIKAVDTAAKFEGIENAFVNLTAGIGGASKVLEALHRGSRETVNDMELMRVSNDLLATGIVSTGQELEEIMTISRRLGSAFGRDLLSSIESLNTGLVRGSALRLDNVNIIVSADEAEKRYREEIGKTTGALTVMEGKHALANEAIRQGQLLMKKLGPDVALLSDSWGQLKSALQNTGLEILKSVTPVLKDLLGELAKFIKENRAAILAFFGDMVEVLGDVAIVLLDVVSSIEKFIGGIEGLKNGVEKFTSGKSTFINDIWDWLVGGLDVSVDEPIKDWNYHINKSLQTASRGLTTAEKIAAVIRDSKKRIADAIRNEVPAQKKKEENAELLALIREQEELARRLQEIQDWRPSAQRRLTMLGEFKQPGLLVGNDDLKNVQQLEEKLVDLRDPIVGAKVAFQKMAEEGSQAGRAIGEIMDKTADVIAGNATEAILEFAQGTATAEEAFRKFASSVLLDISRIILQVTILNAVKAGIGGLGGMVFPVAGAAKGGIFGGHFVPVAGHLALGDIVRQRGLYELAEAGHAEAVVPLPDNRSIPVRFTGRNGSSGGPGMNVVNVTVNGASPGMERRALLQQADTIGAIVLTKMRESQRFREAMAS